MGKYNFDKITNRDNTNCLKYDFKVERGYEPDVLPLWVADMDFQTVPEVTQEIVKVATHGIFGYSEMKSEYFQAISKWFETHHSWNVEPQWLVKTPGVVFALSLAIKAFTQEGDGVLIQNPVYYPFSEVIRDNRRTIVNNSLVYNRESGQYSIDFVDFKQKISSGNVKLFFLCNPQNPTGRVFTREELIKLGDICNRYGVLVISDEIHCDFTYPDKKHIVYASLGEAYENNCIVCTAPSKTFNLAGLQVSNIFIPNENIRRKFKKELDASGYSQLNVVGLVAAKAAYENGAQWQQELKEYLHANLAFLREYINNELPGIKLVEPEGTYLVWLDCSGLKLSDTELNKRIKYNAKLWLDAGNIFGLEGDNFERINIACPRSVLKEALERLKRVY